MFGLSRLGYEPIFSYGTLDDSKPVEVPTEVTTVVVFSVIKSVVVPTEVTTVVVFSVVNSVVVPPEVLAVGSNVVVFSVVAS